MAPRRQWPHGDGAPSVNPSGEPVAACGHFAVYTNTMGDCQVCRAQAAELALERLRDRYNAQVAINAGLMERLHALAPTPATPIAPEKAPRGSARRVLLWSFPFVWNRNVKSRRCDVKTPGRDGHGIKNAGRRASRPPRTGYTASRHRPGQRVAFSDGAEYTVGHFGFDGSTKKGEGPAWHGHSLERAER